MASGENRLIRRRLAGAWLSTVISISLVLLLVGVAGLLVANARSVSDYFKENMQVSVLMKQEVGDDEAMWGSFSRGISALAMVCKAASRSKNLSVGMTSRAAMSSLGLWTMPTEKTTFTCCKKAFDTRSRLGPKAS